VEEELRSGKRLSSIATTGWTNWFHGDLWLFQDGILRAPIGWLKSICLVGYWTELRNPTTRAFRAEEFSRLISNPRNLWIPRAAIKSATLRKSHAFSTLDLRFQMSDGRTIQLLTPARNALNLLLQSVLQEWLGEAFVSLLPQS
jgi:hypothetical protein